MMNDMVSPALVRKACHALLAEGKNPSRPLVQELLATSDYIGRKGSNSLVQRLINEWRQEVGAQLTRPPRTVEGVPEAFVSKMDGLLVEMMSMARTLVVDEFEDQRQAIENERAEMRAAIDQAEQLRLRTEGELAGVQSTISEMREHARLQMEEIEKLRQQLKANEVTLKGKESEIGYLTSQCSELQKQLGNATATAKEAAATHQAEIERLSNASDQERTRLLQQIDDAKQTAKREIRLLQDSLRDAESIAADLRTTLNTTQMAHAATLTRLEAKDEAIAKLHAENGLLLEVEKQGYLIKAELNIARTSLKEAKDRNEQLQNEIHTVRTERVTRYADAERLIEWMDDPKRKSAVLAFTEGLERQIAYRYESAGGTRKKG